MCQRRAITEFKVLDCLIHLRSHKYHKEKIGANLKVGIILSLCEAIMVSVGLNLRAMRHASEWHRSHGRIATKNRI